MQPSAKTGFLTLQQPPDPKLQTKGGKRAGSTPRNEQEEHCTLCSTGHTAQSQKAITSFFESSPHPAPDPQPESSCEPKVKRLRPQEHSDPSDHHGTPTAQKQASIPCTPEELQTVLAFDLNPRFGPTQGRSREERAARAEQLEIPLPTSILALRMRLGSLDEVGPSITARWFRTPSSLQGHGPLLNPVLSTTHPQSTVDKASLNPVPHPPEGEDNGATRCSKRLLAKRTLADLQSQQTHEDRTPAKSMPAVLGSKAFGPERAHPKHKKLNPRHYVKTKTTRPRGRCPSKPTGLRVSGLLFRCTDASLLMETADLKADTALSIDRTAEFLREMLKLETAASHLPPEPHTTRWNEDWLSMQDMGFPMTQDLYHRNLHPAIHCYAADKVQRGNAELKPLLTFRRTAHEDLCASCNQQDPSIEIECDLCRSQYHRRCLGLEATAGTSIRACPACTGTWGKALSDAQKLQQAAVKANAPWERYSIPHHALDPSKLPPSPDKPIIQLLSSPPAGGYVYVQSTSLSHHTTCGQWNVTTHEGIAQSTNINDPFKMSGAQWYFLLALNACKDPTANKYCPLRNFEASFRQELLLQQQLDAKGQSVCFSWMVLKAAKSIWHAEHFVGSTMLAAPHFFRKASRGDLVFWDYDVSFRNSKSREAPHVITLADIPDEELDSHIAPLLASTDWVVLTPTLPPDSDKMKLLSRFGKRILQTKGNALRKQGWWTCGADGLIFSAGSECWVAKSAVLPSDQALENLRTALSTEKTKDEPSIGTSQVERLYNAGTESGLLGVNPEKALILASDGSVDAEGRMWAGVYVSGQTSRLLARIGRDVEGSSSLRAELGGGFLGLRKHKDTAMPVILFSDSETFLEHIEAWIDEGSNKCLQTIEDGDILRAILSLLHYRVARGYPTFLVKLKAHRGDPYNELGDRSADTAAASEDTELLWDAPSGRPIFCWTGPAMEDYSSVKFTKRLRLHLQESLIANPLGPKPRPLGRRWKLIEPNLALKWSECDSDSLDERHEIQNTSLAKALRLKTSFTKQEIDDWDLPRITPRSFIWADGRCYTPGPPDPPRSARLRNSTLEKDLTRSLSLRWRKQTGARPENGREIKHPGLRAALCSTRSFTQETWNALSVGTEIDSTCWVASDTDGNSWFQPVFKTLLASPDAATAIPDHVSLRNVHVRIGQALYQVDMQGHPFAKSFLSRPDMCQEIIGHWLACRLTPDNQAKWIQLAIANMFPTKALLYKWGKESCPNCAHCNVAETYGHLQSRCTLLEKPRTAAHHLIWRELLIQLKAASARGKDEVEDMDEDITSPQGWRFPAAISTLQHREVSVGQILVDLNFFGSLDAVKHSFRLFAQSYTDSLRQTADSLLSGLTLPAQSLDDERSLNLLEAMLKHSTLKLNLGTLVPKSDQELQAMADSFVDLRPDGHAIHDHKKIVSLLEFTRAMDTDDDWEARKDQEKRVRYAPALAFFDQLPNKDGWSMRQSNFTVGVRGSLSTHGASKTFFGYPKLKSFVQELAGLGITQKAAVKRICKTVVIKTLEVHGAMIRSYYAVKFNALSNLNFEKSFKDPHLIQRILL